MCADITTYSFRRTGSAPRKIPATFCDSTSERSNFVRVYNGAMDNASGVAAILETAARLRQSAARPARSILFVAVTGEEKGELGSRYFATHPTVPRGSIVANVNTDM